MARPEKCKQICTMPENRKFTCAEKSGSDETLNMTVEEFECIRLIDYLGMTQEQCSVQMDVARTTVQRLYTDARKKIAQFIIDGCSLEISGGNYRLCENSETCCRLTYCSKKSSECSCPYRAENCIISTLDRA